MAEIFEQKMEAMGALSQEEAAKMMEDVKSVCEAYCGQCPSYAGTGETELGFCSRGKSEIITEEKGCLCAACPITEKMSLRWGYYCTKGSGREQTAEE